MNYKKRLKVFVWVFLFFAVQVAHSKPCKPYTKKSWYKKVVLCCAGDVGIGGSVWLMYSLWKKNIVTNPRVMSKQDILARFDREKIDYRKALAIDPVITFDKA